MALKEFVTAAQSTDGNEVLGTPLRIKVDGRKVGFLPATQGQIAILLAGTSDSADTGDMVASSINFFFALLENRSDVSYFKKRLLDRADPFEADQISEIVAYLVEEWSARPTKAPSDYMQSQSSGGQRSTGPQDYED